MTRYLVVHPAGVLLVSVAFLAGFVSAWWWLR
jgi:hypothetical protein